MAMAASGRPKLSAAELELRGHLLKAAAMADKILPGMRLTLQDWVERRMPGELILRVDANGKVVLAQPGAEAAKRSNKEPPPPPPPSKGGVSAVAVDAEAFLNGLPQDSFTPAEDKLRETILSVLASGPMTKSKVSMHKEVVPALRAFLPRSVPLHKWIESRIGGEVATYDEGGQPMMRLSGDDFEQEAVVEQVDPQQARQASRDEFFSSLPDGAFTQEEEALRFALFDFLAMWRSKELATLGHAVENDTVKKASEALLPPAVEIQEWIEYRIGGEMELKSTATGAQAINLLPPARAVVTARFKEMEQKRKATAAPPAKPMSEAAKKAFLAALPDDELKAEELRLREVLLEAVNALSKPIPLSELRAKPKVAEAERALLPPGFPMEDWMEERVGGEVDVRREQGRAGQSVFIAKISDGVDVQPPRVEEVSPAELERRKEAFFNKLPGDSFAPAEDRLREAILSFLENWQGVGPPLLSQASQELQPIFQTLGRGATLQDWIDRRVGGEVETREHGSDVAFSLQGEMDTLLSQEASSNKGSGKKRKADGPQGGSKGKGKVAYTRSRSDGNW